jgi:gliding motility-associated-like protein
MQSRLWVSVQNKRMNRIFLSLCSLMFVLIFLKTVSLAQSVSCPDIVLENGTDQINFNCLNSACTTVTAKLPDIRNTINAANAYVVSSIPFSGALPFSITGSNAILVGEDDVYSGVINLPFTFCFYGGSYTQMVVGANGSISFNTARATLFSGYLQRPILGIPTPYTIPTAVNDNFPESAIFACLHDIDPSIANGLRRIEWSIVGVAPCRKMVVNWYEIGHYNCTTVRSTFQCVLYENTNVIEMYIRDKPTCNSWNGGLAAIGIQNAQRNQGMTAPGRGNSVWSVSASAGTSEAWRFTPNGISLLQNNQVQLLNAQTGAVLQTINPPTGVNGVLTANFSNPICVSNSNTPQKFIAEATYLSCSGSNVTVRDTIALVLTTPPPPPIVNTPIYYCVNKPTAPLTAQGANLKWYTSATATTGSTTPPTPNTSTVGTTTYYVTQTVNGCESAKASIQVIVQPNNGSTLNVAICPGQSYTFYNGTTYTTANTTATHTFLNAQGCDSIVTLNLTMKSVSYGTQTVSICPGSAYLFNGVNYTSANNTAKDTFINAQGCDSIVTLNLTVAPYASGTLNESICEGESFLFNNVSYTIANNTAKDTFVTAAGCDSIVTLNLSIRHKTYHTVSAVICEGEFFLFNGINYATSNTTATATYINSQGCDSIVTLNLTVNPKKYFTVTAVICQGDSVLFRDQYYHNATNNNVSDTLSTSMGCDSIVSLNLTVLPLSHSTLYATICEGEVFEFNNQNFTTTNNTATQTYFADNGCDSIVTLNLTVLNKSYGNQSATICEGQSYLFNGNLYTTNNNTATDTFINSAGCDSIVTLNLTVNPAPSTTQNLSICQGQSVVVHGVTYSTNQSNLSHIYSTTQGCDSIVITNITVSDYIRVTKDTSICQGHSYTFNGITYTTSQLALLDTFSTASGCDSIVTLNLTVNPALSTTQNISICQGQSVMVNGVSYNTNQSNISNTYTTALGCDSIVMTNITVSDYIRVTKDTSICQGQSYTFNGITYTTSQLALLDTFSTASGCDSIVALNLTVNPAPTNTQNISICQGQSVMVNGVSYNTNQSNISNTYTTALGCDSIVMTNITIVPSDTILINPVICQGQSYNFNGVTYTTPQNGIIMITSTAAGCDSIVKMNLTVNPSVTHTINPVICQGQVYTFNNVAYTTSQNNIIATFQSSIGCDSIVTMNLTVNDTFSTQINQTLCATNLPYTLGTQQLFNTGNYTEAFIAQSGCDSFVHLNLIVNDTFNLNYNVTLCSSATPYIFGNQSLNTSGNYVHTFNTVQGCDSTVHLNLTVNPIQSVHVFDTICNNQLPYLWNGITVTAAGNNVAYYPTSSVLTGCDSSAVLMLSVTPAPTTITFDTAGCGFVWYKGNQYTSNTIVNDTIKNNRGCDSIIRSAHIIIYPNQLKIIPLDIIGCDEVYFNNNYYTSNATYIDSFKSLHGCDSAVHIYNIEVYHFQLTASIDIAEPLKGESVQITTSANQNYNVAAWMPVPWFHNQTAKQQQLVAKQSSDIIIIGKSEKGCIDTALIYLDVQEINKDIFIPNAFSPNGDGLNDRFYPYVNASRGFTIEFFSVFNRFGERVFHTTTPLDGWDGYYKGKKCDLGIYFYQCRVRFIDGEIVNHKGDVSLLR